MTQVKRLEEIFLDCLFKKHEIINDKPICKPTYVKGIMQDFGFHPIRLNGYKEEVQEMINQLCMKFKDGWSFLNLCIDKTGNLWTGSHAECERLVVLAIGLGLAEYKMHKEYWHMLPGSMPYISFCIQ